MGMNSQQPPKHDLLNFRTAIITFVSAIIGLWAAMIPVWNSSAQQSSTAAKDQSPAASDVDARSKIKQATPEPPNNDRIDTPTQSKAPGSKTPLLSEIKKQEVPSPEALQPDIPENHQQHQVIQPSTVAPPEVAPVRKKPLLIRASIPETKIPSELMKPLPGRGNEPLTPEAISKWNSELPGAKNSRK